MHGSSCRRRPQGATTQSGAHPNFLFFCSLCRIHKAQRCFLGTEKHPRKGASGRKQHRVAILRMRDHYGGRQLGAESRGGALSRLLFFSKKDVSWELKQIRAKAPAAVSSIVWPYFACVITMVGGSWELRPATALIQTFIFLRGALSNSQS